MNHAQLLLAETAPNECNERESGLSTELIAKDWIGFLSQRTAAVRYKRFGASFVDMIKFKIIKIRSVSVSINNDTKMRKEVKWR